MKSFKQYLLIGISLFLLQSCKQNSKQQQIAVAKDFLRFYSVELNKNKAPIVLDSYNETASQQCLADKSDTLNSLGFNLIELIDDNSLKTDLQGFIEIISKEKLPSPKVPDSWKSFKKQYKNGFYIISVPIVNDKCDSVIFYYSYYCDERCGNGGMVLYKKAGGKWKLIKEYCKWVS